MCKLKWNKKMDLSLENIINNKILILIKKIFNITDKISLELNENRKKKLFCKISRWNKNQEKLFLNASNATSRISAVERPAIFKN